MHSFVSIRPINRSGHADSYYSTLVFGTDQGHYSHDGSQTSVDDFRRIQDLGTFPSPRSKAVQQHRRRVLKWPHDTISRGDIEALMALWDDDAIVRPSMRHA